MTLKIYGMIPRELEKHFSMYLGRGSIYDQFIQGWYETINESTKLSFLYGIKTIYKRSQCIDMVKKNPEIPPTFTRLRIDTNIYSSYNVKKKIYRHGHVPRVL